MIRSEKIEETVYVPSNDAHVENSKPQWAVFGVNSPIDSEPIIRPRFSSRELAQTYIKDNFPSPQFLQVRERTAMGWSM